MRTWRSDCFDKNLLMRILCKRILCQTQIIGKDRALNWLTDNHETHVSLLANLATICCFGISKGHKQPLLEIINFKNPLFADS